MEVLRRQKGLLTRAVALRPAEDFVSHAPKVQSFQALKPYGGSKVQAFKKQKAEDTLKGAGAVSESSEPNTQTTGKF